MNQENEVKRKDFYQPWLKPQRPLTDSEFQCYNDPVWRVAKLSRMLRQLQASIHTWKDLATPQECNEHSKRLIQLICDLTRYAAETLTSVTTVDNEWPEFLLKIYTHNDITLAFQDDTVLCDAGIEDVITRFDTCENVDSTTTH